MDIDRGGTYTGKTLQLEWSAARLPKEGENYCGDRYLVKEAGDKVLAAAIDGVGHGENAKKAAQAALETLKSFKGESLIPLVENCHKVLRNTRGVVMSLALFDTEVHTMSWISVGNVDGVLLKADGNEKNKSIVLRGGIVGYKLPLLQASVFPVSPGDLLILTTDGVEGSYINNISHNRTTGEIVEYISSNFFKRLDDALVFAARYMEI